MLKKLLLLFLASWLVGCSGISPPARFYTLQPDLSAAPAANAASMSIGLGPIELPDVLDRPQIVVRTNTYSVDRAEFHLWAGDLKDNMLRMMAHEIMHDLGTEHVSIYPWPRHRALDYQVRIDILRFDGELGGKAYLQGTWTLIDGQGRNELKTLSFALSERTEKVDHEALVAAMSRLLTRLGNGITAELAGLPVINP